MKNDKPIQQQLTQSRDNLIYGIEMELKKFTKETGVMVSGINFQTSVACDENGAVAEVAYFNTRISLEL